MTITVLVLSGSSAPQVKKVKKSNKKTDAASADDKGAEKVADAPIAGDKKVDGEVKKRK